MARQVALLRLDPDLVSVSIDGAPAGLDRRSGDAATMSLD
jgi:hypothetical protein